MPYARFKTSALVRKLCSMPMSQWLKSLSMPEPELELEPDELDELEVWRAAARELRGSARSWLQQAPGFVRADRVCVECAVQKDGLALEWADGKLKADESLVLSAVRKGAFALAHAAARLRSDRRFVLQAVRANGYALACAQKFQNDREVVLTAVSEDGSALEYASEQLRRDKTVALTAASSDSALEHVHSSLWRSRDFVRAVLERNEAAWEFIGSELQADRSLLLEVVCLNPRVLDQIEHLDQSFLVEVLGRNASCLQHLEKFQLSDEVLLKALERNKRLLEFFRFDATLLLSAVEVAAEAFDFAPIRMKDDPDLVRELSRKSAATLQYASLSLQQDEAFILQLIEQNPACLQFSSLVCREFNLSALRRNCDARRYIAQEYWEDASFALEALKINELALEHVSENMLAQKQFGFQAVGLRGSALRFLGGNLRDNVLVVAAAAEDNPWALRWAGPTCGGRIDLWRRAVRLDGEVLQLLPESSESLESASRDDAALVLAATRATPRAFRFASERLLRDPAVLWEALKLGAAEAFEALRLGHGQLSACLHFPQAAQAAEDEGVLLSAIAQNGAVLGFAYGRGDSRHIPLRERRSFVAAAVARNPAALDHAPRSFHSDPTLLRAAPRFPTACFDPEGLVRELQRVAAGLSGRGALERGVGLTLGGSSSRVLFAVLELARLEQLGCDSLQKECVLLGLPPECLDWYGANFLVRRLKQLALWKELELCDLCEGGPRRARAYLRVGAHVRVAEDFQSLSHVKLKMGLCGTVAALSSEGNAQISFSPGVHGTQGMQQWIYQSDVSKLQVEGNKEQRDMVLQELATSLFAGFYEAKGVPIRQLETFSAASSVLERWESLYVMPYSRIRSEFRSVLGIDPGGQLTRDDLEEALRNAALWAELPMWALAQDCSRRSLCEGSDRADAVERLLRSLCQESSTSWRGWSCRNLASKLLRWFSGGGKFWISCPTQRWSPSTLPWTCLTRSQASSERA
ncbi:unnamed protein product [Effrenium voratum]|nr:unnamed protein product [Effrenium voratum]